MPRNTFAVVAVLIFVAPAVVADDKSDAGDRTHVVKFFKEHIIGKTLATPKTTFKLHDNKMEGVYEDQTSFTNFTETAQAFSFDVTTVSKETRYELDKDGKRVGTGRDMSGVEVYRYEICERASTKKLTGTARALTWTTKATSPEGTAVLVTGVKIVDGKLVWNETMPGYCDLVDNNGKYKAGSWDSKYTFSLVGGKLVSEYETKRYDVDADTLKRTPTNDKLPLFVAKEIEQK
jgi:hypothetical protein